VPTLKPKNYDVPMSKCIPVFREIIGLNPEYFITNKRAHSIDPWISENSTPCHGCRGAVATVTTNSPTVTMGGSIVRAIDKLKQRHGFPF
jgi:hypothetical protein